MFIKDICIDLGMQETVFYENPMLGHVMYVVEYDRYRHDLVPWHWHDELELLYLASGECIYRTVQGEYHLREGDAVFLNSGVLHALEPVCKNTVSYANLFKKAFLTGGTGNFWDFTYLLPVLQRKNLGAVPIYQCREEHGKVLELVRETVSLAMEEPPFYELRLRNVISEIWMFLLEMIHEMEQEGEILQTEMNDVRMKKIFLYIMEQYTGKIRISDLAVSANISERECYRMFQKYLGETPGVFIQKYRIRAAGNLLITTDRSVTEIASETGFESISYFGKLFKRYMNLTPLEFRSRYRKK